MELRQLRYFVAVAEELHYGRAAERLRISTPTLSQQIAALERSLQQRLLQRTSSRVSLTAAGAALLEEARLVLAAAERARDAVADTARTGHQLSVRVATGMQHVIGDQLRRVENNPDLVVSLQATANPDATEAVLHGRADGAFVWCRDSTDHRLQSILLASAAVGIALPRDHRLAQLSAIPVSALQDETIALFPRSLGPGMWDVFVHHLRPAGLGDGRVVNLRTTLTWGSAMLEAVARGEAVAPFTQVVAERMYELDEMGIVLRPLDPPLDLPAQFVWRPSPHPLLQELIDFLSELAPAAEPDSHQRPPGSPSDPD